MARILKEFIVDNGRETFRHTVELVTTATVADINLGAIALAEDLLTFEPPAVISPDDVQVKLSPGVDHTMVLTHERVLINMPYDATPGERLRYQGEPSMQHDQIKTVPEGWVKTDLHAERAWRHAPAPVAPVLGAMLGLPLPDRL